MDATIGLVRAGMATANGPVRATNEDTARLADPLDPLTQSIGYLAVVADGMGGQQRGEEASALAVATLFAVFYAVGDGTDDSVPARLRRGFAEANARVHALAGDNLHGRGPGTTLIAAAIRGDRLTIANVGDSRAYLVRADTVAQLSRDHTLVAEQCLAGFLSPAEAHASPLRNVLTRALGQKSDVAVDVFALGLRPNDRVLLCTDGVHGHIRHEEFALVSDDADPDRASRALIDLALARGTTDNVSAAVVAFRPGG